MDASVQQPIGRNTERRSACRHRHLPEQPPSADRGQRGGIGIRSRMTPPRPHLTTCPNCAPHESIRREEKHYHQKTDKRSDQPYRKDPVNQGSIKTLVGGLNYMTRKKHF